MKKLVIALGILGTALCHIYFAFYSDRNEFSEILLFAGVGFIALAVMDRIKSDFFPALIVLGIAMRLLYLFQPGLPTLSDDFYRFIWDGKLLSEGYNPYLELPSEFQMHEFDEQRHSLLEGMNSEDYYSVYPPVNQVLFAIPSYLLPDGDLQSKVRLIRMLIIAFEMALIFLMIKVLLKLKIPKENSLMYALNPLVIIELCGNLHFEGVVLFFVFFAIFLWLKRKKWLAALVYGLAVSVKIIPLIFLPLILKRKGGMKNWLIAGIPILIFILGFLPFYSPELLQKFWTSLDLFFQKFEFNASIYYLLRFPIETWLGYNPIQNLAPILSLCTFMIIIFLSWSRRKISSIQEVTRLAIVCLSIHFFLSTTVHPWYIITLVGLTVLGNLRYPIFWSFLIILSYSHYNGGGFIENYQYIAVEYVVLGIAIFTEWKTERRLSNRLQS